MKDFDDGAKHGWRNLAAPGVNPRHTNNSMVNFTEMERK
jgi:hypothetical protein